MENITLIPDMNSSTAVPNSTLVKFPVENVTKEPEDVTLTTPIPTLLLSLDDYKRLNLILYAYVAPVICIVGLIGNGLGLRVLLRTAMQMKVSIYIYIFALTLNDVCMLLTAFVRCCPKIIKLFDEPLGNHLDADMTPFIIPFDLLFTCGSVYLILVISAERLFAIYKPMTVKDTFLAKWPISIVIAILIGSILSSWPFGYMLQSTVSYDENNMTSWDIDVKEEFVDSGAWNSYLMFINIFQMYLPFMFIVTINVAILIKYVKVTKRRAIMRTNESTDAISNQQMKVTSVIIVLTGMYIAFGMPQYIVTTMAFVDEEYIYGGAYAVVFLLFSDICNILIYINGATDFLVYILRSESYRTMFKEMYGLSCTKQKPHRGFSEVYNISGKTSSLNDA